MQHDNNTMGLATKGLAKCVAFTAPSGQKAQWQEEQRALIQSHFKVPFVGGSLCGRRVLNLDGEITTRPRTWKEL